MRRLAWCTGGAQDLLAEAVELGVDGFLTGEVSERTVHLSRETGVAFLAAGHHATERYGVQAVGAHLAAEFGLEHVFLDDDNPV
jgi:putative NIF3 family GTP cyclohydrolase 1 type 2